MARGIFADMNHLSTRVRLLMQTGQSYGIKLAFAVITFQNHRWIFPCHGATCFNLRPTDVELSPSHKPRLVTKL